IICAFFFLSTLSLSLGQEGLQFKIDELSKENQRKAESEKFERLTGLYMDYVFETYPEFGTYVGKPTDNSKWTDLSLEAHEKRKKEISMFLDAVEKIDVSKLEIDDRLDYQLFRNSLLEEKEGAKYP